MVDLSSSQTVSLPEAKIHSLTAASPSESAGPPGATGALLHLYVEVMKKPKDARVKDENDFEWLKQLEPQRTSVVASEKIPALSKVHGS